MTTSERGRVELAVDMLIVRNELSLKGLDDAFRDEKSIDRNTYNLLFDALLTKIKRMIINETDMHSSNRANSALPDDSGTD